MLWSGLYHLYLTSLPVRQFMQKEVASGVKIDDYFVSIERGLESKFSGQ